MSAWRRVGITIGLSAATLLAPEIVVADCDLAGPIEQEIPKAEVAFVGTVRATAAGGSIATFAVEEVWRGSLAEQVEVRGLSNGDRPGEDDRIWTVGRRYLVLPVQFEGALLDNICTATTEWRPELAELRPAGVPRADVGPPGAVLIALAAFVVLGVVGALAFRRGSLR